MGMKFPRGEGAILGLSAPLKRILESAAVCTKTAEPIAMPFGVGSCESREPCIEWDQGRTNQFTAARGDRTAMRPFLKIL